MVIRFLRVFLLYKFLMYTFREILYVYLSKRTLETFFLFISQISRDRVCWNVSFRNYRHFSFATVNDCWDCRHKYCHHVNSVKNKWSLMHESPRNRRNCKKKRVKQKLVATMQLSLVYLIIIDRPINNLL